MDQSSRGPDLAIRPSYNQGQQPLPAEYFHDDSSNSDSLGIVEYWRLINRRRGTLILISFFGLLAGILFTLPQTPLYRSRATLEIQNLNSGFMNAKQANPVDDSSASTTDVQTQIKIIQSESLIERVVDKLKTQNKLARLQGLDSRFSSLRRILNLPNPAADTVETFIRTTALGNLTVRQLGQTRILEITYNSPDADFASVFVNTLAVEYIQSNMEARWKMSEHTSEWLTAQLDEMRIKLERSETVLQNYARDSGLLFTGNTATNDRNNVSEERLRQLQDELSKAQGARTAVQSRYEISQSAPPGAIGDVLNDASLRQLRDKITELSRARAEAAVIYTPKHEKVKLIEAQISPLQNEFDRERAAILARIKNDYETALRHEQLLRADYRAQTHVVTDEAGKSIQYNILKRDVDSNRDLYQTTLQQVKESSVAAAMRASNIRVVDPAKIPRAPYAPNLKGNAVVGLLAGALLGVGFILAHERANRTLMQPGDAQFWTNLPELGVVPCAKFLRGGGYGRALQSYYGNDPHRANGIPAAARINGSVREPVELISWKNKPSAIAEAFRTILTSILFIGENGARPKVLVLTSASAGEGKTTLVSNLGIAMAEIHRKVLIIDADLRRPRIHSLFKLPNDEGLSTLLSDRSAVGEAYRLAIRETAVPGLSVLCSGPPTSAAANLLYSPNMADLLARVKKEYDLVLIDTPPTLLMTDARVLGRLADAVVIVTRANQTTRDAVLAVSKRFSDDGIRVIGTVLNDWDPRNAPNGYYGYHGYSGGNSQKYGYQYSQVDQN
jgi:capsular exopolysaccharide synthesis family protein